MRARGLLLLIVGLMAGLLGTRPAMAQGTTRGAQSDWTAYTSMREVSAVAASEQALWAATLGGVFRYEPGSGTFTRFTAADGLHNVQTRAIAIDEAGGGVWVGYGDGALDRIDLATGAVRTLFDIARSDRFPDKGINRLVVQGDSLLVATAFGLVVFDLVREEVRDTYTQLGALASGTPVRDVLVAPVPGGGPGLWLAAGGSIAYAPLSASNLQDPAVWTVEAEGLPSEGFGEEAVVLSLARLGGTLVVGAERGIAVRNADGTFTDRGITDQPVRAFLPFGEALLAVDRFKAYILLADGNVGSFAPGFFELNDLVFGPGGDLWLADGEEALSRLVTAAGAFFEVAERGIAPAGPFDGLFSDLAVAPDGGLWAAASSGEGGSGVHRLGTDGQWTDYAARFVPELQGFDRFGTVHVDALGNAWAGSLDDGVVQITPEGEVVAYNHTNSSLREVSPGFVPVTGLASEADGTLWVTNREATQPLHVRLPDGTWAGLPPPSCPGITAASALGDILVDAFGQKWIVVLNPVNFNATRGVLVLDSGSDPADASDDTCRLINREATVNNPQGLPNPQEVNALAEDREGRVWIGTGRGPAYVISNRVVAQDPSNQPILPQRTFVEQGSNPYVLFGVPVNDLTVDPANRVWMATDLGAYRVEASGGGFDEGVPLTTATTPLFSNTIVAIAVRPETGEVFFATDDGLLGQQGDAVAPAPDVQDLFVYPNPVRLQGDTGRDVFIDGLVEETEIQIVAPHGEVVARLTARGGRARWDARDRNQELVPSGVYLVVAIGQNGEGTAYGKVAVIR